MINTGSNTAEQGSVTLHELTIVLTSTLKQQVTFEGKTDTSVTLEEISISNDDKTGASTRKSSITSFSELKLKNYKLAVTFGICCIILLFMLPIIFYYVETGSKVNSGLSPTTTIRTVNVSQSTFCNDSMTLNCTDDLIYTYEALRSIIIFPFCIDETKKPFAKLQNCGDDSKCVESIMCQEVRQEYCTAEWRTLELIGSEGLIDCSDYGETAPITCGDQFGLANNSSMCLPLCKEFSRHRKSFIVIYPTWLAVFSGINVIGGIISLVISVYRIKKLFCYPQILIVINSILISVLSLSLLVSSIPVENWSPLCSKEFLSEALEEPNLFCQIHGSANFAIVALYCYFWFLYTLHLFLRVAKPIQMVRLEQSKYFKIIHIIEVTLAVLLAVVPNAVFAINSDFNLATFPPYYCATSAAQTFYATIVPTILVSCASLIMMLFVLYNVHIRKGLFRRSDKSSKFCCINFSIAEVKVFLTFCYLLIVMVLLWTGFTIDITRFNTTFSIILTYVQCMSGGIRKELDCEPYRRQFEGHVDSGVILVYYTLFSLLSYSNLPFLIQFKTVKHFVVKTARRLNYNRSSVSSTMT